ncbi:VWA domain-containing protein [Algimonas porphyrae]|uniref:VWA domain-containing protein n=1 Tax=Algimonas porphyrae TaxID=1128113 RepID=A0ABQ5UVY4_9PROT|nr:VWA domain-containing protein [Algimonas porphyrae]GLQ19257.1 VWA domain-containing protein [Algimonas porphyrae]
MFHHFFSELRRASVPVSIREYLTLLEGVDKGVANDSLDGFYYLSRTALVKDERDLDKFDQVFSHVFRGIDYIGDIFGQDEHAIPEDWLRKMAELHLSPEEMAEIEALGDFDKIMEALKERLDNQDKRHEGGNRNIGTAGRSPFGAYGYNPEGVRIGQKDGRHGKAVKVWDKRQFKNLDGDKEIGTRNIKVALRRLRKFAREGAAEELDLPGTIRGTARQGWLDIRMRPERRNAVKVLTFFDIGGSMDAHVKQVEDLFSAAKSEFKRLEHFYFHNMLYEQVWRDNRRRMSETTPTWDILHTFPSDHRVVIVGDAAMSPYEVAMRGGSVEHWNEEAGAVWLKRIADVYPHLVWINPTQEKYWEFSQSTQMIQEIIGGERMFPMTLNGLEDAMRELAR